VLQELISFGFFLKCFENISEKTCDADDTSEPDVGEEI
jgi:hypothetical protein